MAYTLLILTSSFSLILLFVFATVPVPLIWTLAAPAVLAGLPILLGPRGETGRVALHTR